MLSAQPHFKKSRKELTRENSAAEKSRYSALTPSDDPNESRVEQKGDSKKRQQQLNDLKKDFSKALKHIAKLEADAKETQLASKQAKEKQEGMQR